MEILEGDWGYGQARSKEDLINILMAYQQAVDFSVISSITDIKGRIIYVNKQFCNVSKYRAEELIGQKHNMINSGYHSKAFFKEMWKTIGQGNVWYGEIKNLAKDNTIYWVNSVIVPIKNAEGKPHHYLSLRTLISERKAQEEKKHEMHVKNMEDMLFKISHEVRQPIVQIMALTALINTEEKEHPEQLKKLLTLMQRAAQTLDQYSRELSAFVNKITPPL